MPWWMWLWSAALTVLTVAGAAADVSDGEPRWYTAMGFASGLACVLFVLNHAGVVRLGNLIVPAALTLVALGYEAWRDVAHDPDLTLGQKCLAALLTLGLFAPAALLAIRDAME